MTEPSLDAVLARVSRSSNRMRIAMGITSALCVLIAAGIAADGSGWTGWGWRIGGAVGIAFFGSVAILLAYAALWRQQRHIAKLRRVLQEEPNTVRSIKLLVARAVPVASWSPDDGSARTGLHVAIEDIAGNSWLLPLSRADAPAVIDGLTRRCPQATND